VHWSPPGRDGRDCFCGLSRRNVFRLRSVGKSSAQERSRGESAIRDSQSCDKSVSTWYGICSPARPRILTSSLIGIFQGSPGDLCDLGSSMTSFFSQPPVPALDIDVNDYRNRVPYKTTRIIITNARHSLSRTPKQKPAQRRQTWYIPLQ
jgi:hypothetical protein